MVLRLETCVLIPGLDQFHVLMVKLSFRNMSNPFSLHVSCPVDIDIPICWQRLHFLFTLPNFLNI